MDVKIKELADACRILLSHVQDTVGETVTIDEDYYWDVPDTERFKVEENPQRLTIGQLSEDLSEITAILEGKKEPLGYGLVWLAALLRRIGETHVP